MIKKTALIFLVYGSIFISGCAPHNIADPQSSCIVVPPKEFNTTDAGKISYRLAVLGGRVFNSDVEKDLRKESKVIFQQVPSEWIGCFMYTQTIACISKQSESQYAIKDILSVMDKDHSCQKSTNIDNGNGKTVYIQYSDESQLNIANKLRIALGDINFGTPGIEKKSPKDSPRLPEVRFFHDQDFDFARLVKQKMEYLTNSEVLLRPMQGYPGTQRSSNPIEIWFPVVN